MDYKDRERGNWAFIQLREAYFLLLEYESSYLIDRGEIPHQESGPRLYMASIKMAEVMRDRAYFLDWADEKLSESPQECLSFPAPPSEYRWACRDDVENTLLDISSRIFERLAPIFSELLQIRQREGTSERAVLADFRWALQVENKALSRNQDPTGKERDFVLNVVERLFSELAVDVEKGRHQDGVLGKGVMTRARNAAAACFGFTEAEAQKVWSRHVTWLHRRVFRARNGTSFALLIQGRKVTLIPQGD